MGCWAVRSFHHPMCNRCIFQCPVVCSMVCRLHHQVHAITTHVMHQPLTLHCIRRCRRVPRRTTRRLLLLARGQGL
jgi:hypothetical protein